MRRRWSVFLNNVPKAAWIGRVRIIKKGPDFEGAALPEVHRR
jgi:hypothetical protein